MRKKYISLIILTILFCACEFTTPADDNFNVINEDENIFIQDRTGKKWDITHAVNIYGFDPKGFQYGLGPTAIPPINDPEFLVPGDVSYPGNSEAFLMIGTDLNQDARAYPLWALSSHEVVNDKFGDDHVAVAY